MSKRRQKALVLMKLKKKDGGSKNCITKFLLREREDNWGWGVAVVERLPNWDCSSVVERLLQWGCNSGFPSPGCSCGR